MMKKITFLAILLLTTNAFFAQTYSTGPMIFDALYSAQIDVNSTTNVVTMTLNGPSDRYFGIGFGVINMNVAGSDCVIYTGNTGTGTTILSDRSFNGNTSTPSVDASQDWNVTSNTVSGTTRTIVATRARVSAGDYTFPATATAGINFAWSYKSSADYGLQYHGGTRGAVQASFTLGNEKFEQESFKMFPNPATASVSLQFPEYISKGTVKIYDNLGRVVKTSEINSIDLNISTQDLSTGNYLVVVRTEYGNSTKNLLID